MVDLWTEAQDNQLTRAVIVHRFDFSKVAAELNVTEEAARVRWTLLYCQQQGLEPPPLAKASSVTEAPKTIVEPSKAVANGSVSEAAVPSEDVEIITSVPARKDFLDISDVDFSQQTSVSITGEIITPSRFNIFDHSLKDTCDQIRMRAAACLPKMDFILNGEETEEALSQFRSRLEGSNLIFERFDESIGEWYRSDPIVELPSMDDIKLIPDDYNPSIPSGKYASQVQNLTPAEVWQEPKAPAPQPYKEVFYKGTKTLVKPKESSSESEEEDLEALKRARQKLRGRVMKEVEPTPIEFVEDEEVPPLQKIDLDKDTSSMTPAYRKIIQTHRESQKEAMQLIKELQEKWQKEKDEEKMLKAKERNKKEEEKRAEILKQQEEENKLIQAEREKKLQARYDNLKRKQEIVRQKEEEAEEALKRASQRKFEEEVRSQSEFNLFEKAVSFGAVVPCVSSTEGLQVIAAEVCEEAIEALWYFSKCSDVFGEADEDADYFKLAGVFMTSASSQSETLQISTEASSKRILCLGLVSNPRNSRPLKAFLSGFPLNVILGRSSAGKLFLSDLFYIVESFSYGERNYSALEVFSGHLSMHVVGTEEKDYKFASIVIKPLFSVDSTVEMLKQLIDQARESGLDLVGMRTVAVTAEVQQSIQSTLNYMISYGTSLSLCFYGPKASTALGEIMGPEGQANARKHKPRSLHAKYPGQCGYMSINSAKSHRDACYFFGGRQASLTKIPALQIPPSQSCTIVLGPEFGVAAGMSVLEWILRSSMNVQDYVRCELSEEAEAYLTKPPSKTVTVLGVKAQIRACHLIRVSRPNMWEHVEAVEAHLQTTSEDYTCLTQDEEAFLSVLYYSSDPYNTPSRTDFPYVSCILLTPEAFKVDQGQLPASVFIGYLLKRAEVVGMKSLKSSDCTESLKHWADITDSTLEWISSGYNLLIAVRAIDPDSGLDKAILACNWQNKGVSHLSKPLYLKISDSSLFTVQELSSDPSSVLCPFTVCPTNSAHFNDFSYAETLSVAVVKPERNRNMLKQLLRGLSKHCFEIVYAEGKRLSHQHIDILYANSHDAVEALSTQTNSDASLGSSLSTSKLDFNRFKEASNGSSVVFKVRRVNAIQKLLELAGHPDPSKANTNSLRGAFGTSIEDNGLHCSASIAHAEAEANLLCRVEDYGQLNPEDIDMTKETICCFGQLTTSQLSSLLETMLKEGFKLLALRVDVFAPFQLLIYAEVAQKQPSWIEAMTNKTCAALAFYCPLSNNAESLISSLGLQDVLSVSRSNRESVQELSIFFNEVLV
mmetsp:Transcript_12303/g.23347  ORF Transcript_12303/g.23347 Transcript_12303/m.23347 type:complete len:1288 (-) Transcript_12303:2122-5985(-)